MDTLQVAVDEIVPRNNDREVFDQQGIEELAESIAAVGLVQPIRVRPREEGGYELIAGERRWRAHLHLGRRTIDAVVTDASDRAAKDAMLAENMARRALNPIEEAKAYRERIDEFGETIEEVARVAGRQPAHIRWRLGLLDLAPDIIEQVASGNLRHTFAEAMVGLDANRQRAVVGILGKQKLSLDELWKLTERMRAEQAEQALFDDSQFELHAEEYVERAKRDTRALTVRQLARLTDEVLVGYSQLLQDADLPSDLARKVERLRDAVAYRLENAKTRGART